MRSRGHRGGRLRRLACLLPLVAMPSAVMPGGGSAADVERQVVEIRAYNLKPGARARFHRLFVEEALPLLEARGIEVVAWGPSLHDDDSWFLVRAFPGLAERTRLEDAFYGSKAWREGPRAAVLELIESYTTIVLPRHDPALQALTPER